MRVQYHIGPDNGYSLAFVGETEDALIDWEASQDTAVRLRYIDAPDDERIALAYTPSQASPDAARAVDLSEWSEGTATIALAYLTAFTGVTDATEVLEHKAFDARKVEQALERVEWRQSIAEVAGELWSNLVLAHPLPNANHRSALALVALYLHAQDDSVRLADDLQHRSETAALANTFFVESKRILSVRRKARQFGILAAHGVEEVERKGGIVITLDDYDWSIGNPYQTYADAHREVSVEFVRSYLEQTGSASLASTDDPGKNAFVQQLAR